MAYLLVLGSVLVSHLSFAMTAPRLVSAFARSLVCQRPFRRASARQRQKQATSRSHLFGSKAAAGNPPGDIAFYDEQNVLKLDRDRLCRTVTDIRRLIGYDTYDVTLILVDDDEMQSINKESRGIDAPTDILSFPFHGAVEAGVLEDVKFDIPDYYMLVSGLCDEC